MQSKSQIRSIGIDLGKTTFQLVALGNRCQVGMRKKVFWSTTVELHDESAFLPDWNGGLRGVALSGPSPA
jgi:hypothetical protein